MKQPPVIVVQLVHIAGPMKGQIETFSEGSISIGRKPTCNLCFPPDLANISRVHADIVREGNQFKLIDHSTNGTLVNGKLVKEAYLKDGDILEFSQGGPKVSFLTAVQDTVPQPSRPMPFTRKEPPEERPVPEVQKKPTPPAAQVPAEPFVQETNISLIIQYGPTIRSFSKMPVVIGRSPTCEFVIDRPSILSIHAQIFHSQNQYWIKDLSSQQSVRINGQSVGVQAPFAVNDEIALSPHGPVFRVVGDGRLAEIEEPLAEKPQMQPRPEEPESEESGGLLSRFRKYIDDKLR